MGSSKGSYSKTCMTGRRIQDGIEVDYGKYGIEDKRKLFYLMYPYPYDIESIKRSFR